MKEKWKVLFDGITHPTIDDSNGNTIAVVTGCGLESSGAQIRYAVNRRARLIAAAPEMLELLDLLAAGYSISESMYDLRCRAEALVAKIERDDA